ncbi:MAG TPA: DoxX family protein [Candidatus Aquilonibacter sp.]|nr:DoxX family protein [Candidatus Aquilonibacter sp.]
MFAGVPYLISILFVGLVIGTILATHARSWPDSEVARAFYRLTAFLLTVSFSLSVWRILGPAPKVVVVVATVFGGVLSVSFATIFGMAIRRDDSRRLLGQPQVLDAIRMTVALTFAIAGIGKAFNMPFMTEFFVQSGYSITFLHFIMIAEVLGAVGLLLPWAFFPAVLGFTIDMFGAIVTHVHNGDPLDDSAGAISMLIRIAAIAAIIVITPEGETTRRSLRSKVLIASCATIGCLAIAISGSFILHAVGSNQQFGR